MAELSARLLLPPKGARVLCAVSGGADSMCLLALLLRTGGCSVAAAHFEHGIRGEESLRDCAFVEEFCRAKGIVCYTAHADVPAWAKEHGLGLEAAARELRYAFLEQTAEREGYDFVATAHNADDNAETVLLHLTRGSGLDGLCGIPPQRGRIIRPLLKLTRAEIEGILAELSIPHVEDSSNGEDITARNRIRRDVMPVLRSLNPALEAAIGRESALLRRDGECLDALAQDFLSAQFNGESLPLAELNRLHPAVGSRVVKKLLGHGAEEKHVAAILALCAGEGLGWADVPGARVRRERGRLYFSGDESTPIPETPLPAGTRVLLPEAGLAISTKIVSSGEEIHNSFKTYALKYESICGNLSVSSLRPGERYRPQGRGCTKTLKALFAEQKMTVREKLSTPVLRDEAGIVLVPPFGAAERCVPRAEDKKLVIEFTDIENN